MQRKAAGRAGALYLVSPVAVPGLTLKTRGGADSFSRFWQNRETLTAYKIAPGDVRARLATYAVASGGLPFDLFAPSGASLEIG
jgi:hypothetical protein